MMHAVKDTADWGTITRAQARHYCATVGLPNPLWPGDDPDPRVQDALDELAAMLAEPGLQL